MITEQELAALHAQLAAVTTERDAARGLLETSNKRASNWFPLDSAARELMRACGETLGAQTYYRRQFDKLRAALAAAPSEAGEREKLGEELIAWAADPAKMILPSEDGWFCFMCDCQPNWNDHESSEASDPEKVVIEHRPDCLHVRAAALMAADAGKEKHDYRRAAGVLELKDGETPEGVIRKLRGHND